MSFIWIFDVFTNVDTFNLFYTNHFVYQSSGQIVLFTNGVEIVKVKFMVHHSTVTNKCYWLRSFFLFESLTCSGRLCLSYLPVWPIYDLLQDVQLILDFERNKEDVLDFCFLKKCFLNVFSLLLAIMGPSRTPVAWATRTKRWLCRV